MPKHRLGAALALALLFCATADAAAFGFSPPVQTPTYGEAESVAIGDVSGDGRGPRPCEGDGGGSWDRHPGARRDPVPSITA